jgi:transposase
MTRSTRKNTKEFKQEAITLALKSASIGHTSKELGIPSATLHRWINELKKTGHLERVSVGEAKDMTTLIEENRRLQKELSIVKEEKEILKKAATYFAAHQK